MNKGLEALKHTKETFNNLNIKGIPTLYQKECLDTIEKELKDYYALKKECEEAKWYQEHKALEIIKKYPKNRNSLANFCYMVNYWERNKIKVTKELLETYDFPFEVDELNLLRGVLL